MIDLRSGAQPLCEGGGRKRDVGPQTGASNRAAFCVSAATWLLTRLGRAEGFKPSALKFARFGDLRLSCRKGGRRNEINTTQ